MRRCYAVTMLVASCFSTQVLSNESMTFMRETPQERQIIRTTSLTREEIIARGPMVLYPTISADGEKIAFSQGDEPQKLGIYIWDASTSKTRNVVPPEGFNLHADFSGDGRLLAFSGPDAQGKNQIHIVSVEDPNQARMITTPHAAYFPSLSSHGDFVVLHQSQENKRRFITRVEVASGKAESLTPEDGDAMEPALSFDEQNIVYSAQEDGQWDLYLMNLKTKQTHRLTHSPAKDFAPTFKADGSIVFASDTSGSFDLYEIRAAELSKENPVVTHLLASEHQEYSPEFSGTVEYLQNLLPAFPEPGRSSFGAARLGHRVYMAGGHSGPEHTYPPASFVGQVLEFDLLLNRWRETAPLSIPRQGFELVAHDGFLYAFGGFTYSSEHQPGWKSLDIIERYDPTRKVWEIIGHMPRPRSSHVAAKSGDKVYLIGGWDSTPQSAGDKEGRFHDSIDVFDLKTLQSSTLATTLPAPKRRALSAVVHEGQIYLIGGIGEGSSHFSFLANVTRFDPQEEAWHEEAPLPFATFAPASGAIREGLFVFGGMFQFADMDYRYVPHIYRFDWKTRQWRHTGRFLAEAKGFSQVVELADETFMILGGHVYRADKDEPVSTVEWFGLPRMPDRPRAAKTF